MAATTPLWKERRTEVQSALERLLTPSQPELQRQIDQRFLKATSTGRHLTLADVGSIIHEMHGASLKGVEDFETIYEQRVRARLKAARKQTWLYVFPLALACDESCKFPASFSLLHVTFTLEAWADAVRNIPADKLTAHFANTLKVSHETTPGHGLTCEVSAATEPDAWSEVSPALDAFRGATELLLGNMTQQWASHTVGMRSIVGHPPWALIWRDSQQLKSCLFLVDRRSESRLQRQTETFTAKRLEALKHNVEEGIGSPADDKDIRAVMADALRLYVQALDANYDHLCFLGLWQAVEAMTLVGDHAGSGGKACARLAELVRNTTFDTSQIKHVFDELYVARNEIVHRGIHAGIGQEEVNFLKTMCEIALIWLTNRQKELPTREHLERFYELASATEPRIQSLTETMTFIQRYRKEHSGKAT